MTAVPRVYGTVVRAPQYGSYGVRLDTTGERVQITRQEAHRCNYRLVEGDRISFRTYRSGGQLRGFEVILHNVGIRKPLVPPPPYAMLGPCVRVGVWPAGRR